MTRVIKILNKIMKIDYNDIMNFKQKIEELYPYLRKAHQNILNLLEDLECIDDEKFDQYYSYIKEYEAQIENIKSDFLMLSSENKKIESCLNQTKLLKKRRLSKLQSNMNDKYDPDDPNYLPF